MPSIALSVISLSTMNLCFCTSGCFYSSDWSSFWTLIGSAILRPPSSYIDCCTDDLDDALSMKFWAYASILSIWSWSKS